MAQTNYDPKAEYYAIKRIRHSAQGKHYEPTKKNDKGKPVIEETFTLEHLEEWQIAYLVENQKAIALVPAGTKVKEPTKS